MKMFREDMIDINWSNKLYSQDIPRHDGTTNTKDKRGPVSILSCSTVFIECSAGSADMENTGYCDKYRWILFMFPNLFLHFLHVISMLPTYYFKLRAFMEYISTYFSDLSGAIKFQNLEKKRNLRIIKSNIYLK